jgi:hypothetical protein
MFKHLTRIGLAGLLTLSALAHAANCARSLRIGYQKGSVSMVLAKSHQLLEKRFPNTTFSWVEFPAGHRCWKPLTWAVSIWAVPAIFRLFSRRLPVRTWCMSV